jgi:type IV secretion system protein VirB3
MSVEVEIYKGCTRPAMKYGVPVQPLMYTMFGGLVIGVWGMVFTQSPWWMLSVFGATAGAIFWMRHVTKHDPQKLDQVVRAAGLWWRHRRGLAFWKCRTYSPITYHGAPDAWLD